jgi:predicted nucleic acid-binding protein
VSVVLDTSVAVKLFFPEEHSDKAVALVTDATRTGEPIIAPYLLTGEFVNSLRRRMRRDRVPLPEAAAILDDFLALPIDYQSDPAIYRRALILTERYSLSGFDAQFVALAEIAGCDLWVDDGGMLGAIAGRLSFVKSIGDYPIAGGAGR